jgi:hypothetical protein
MGRRPRGVAADLRLRAAGIGAVIQYDSAMDEAAKDGNAAREPAVKKLSDDRRSAEVKERRLQLALLALMLAVYGALLGVSWWLQPTDTIRLTFNSMLDHLLRGQFDVDPRIIGDDGFLRNGRVYAYWGIWCALLRLPLKLIGRMNVDMTFWSCLAAVCVAGMAKVRAVLLVRSHALNNATARWAIGLLLAYFVLAGGTCAYLKDEVWTEVMLWAYAFAAVFVCFAMKGIVNREFDARSLFWMGLSAGLALLTRVSTGVGLVLSLLLLLIALALKPGTVVDAGKLTATARIGRAGIQHRMWAPLAIVGVSVVVSGAVNYFRWGNPATFLNYDLYINRDAWPNFVSSLSSYGAFNLRRVPFGLIYYFVPVWVLHGRNGQLLFEDTQTRLFGDIELPPASFLLTDLIAFCFIALLVVGLRKRVAAIATPAGTWAALVGLGLLAPCLLMLSLDWLTYRYRVDFYPEFDFLALLGLYVTVTDEAMLKKFARLRSGFSVALAVSVLASVAALTLHDISDEGGAPPEEILNRGVVRYYKDTLHDYRERVVVGLRRTP